MDADLADAARLLRYAWQPRLRVNKDEEYHRLVTEWPNRPELQRATEAIADGLGVWILTVDPKEGIVACGEADGPFELKMSDFLRQARAENQWSLRVVFAVAMLATWRLCYPNPAHLDDATRVARVSVNEVMTYVDSLCQRLDERAEEADEDVNPPADEPGLERAWRAWSRRGETARTPDGRRSSQTTAALVSRALGWMADQGLLDKASDDDGGTYRARPRLRMLVREVADEHLYREVLALDASADDVPSEESPREGAP